MFQITADTSELIDRTSLYDNETIEANTKFIIRSVAGSDLFITLTENERFDMMDYIFHTQDLFKVVLGISEGINFKGNENGK